MSREVGTVEYNSTLQPTVSIPSFIRQRFAQSLPQKTRQRR